MPFIGRDWRSPGEAWVKTESLGWQRMKIIESQLYLTCHQNHSNACSWPPRGHFGQHMEEHCSRQTDADGLNHKAAAVAVAIDHPAELDFIDPVGSQTSSSSTSPIGTPERSSNARHIHPITISSPYGRFTATCCAHNNSGGGSPCRPPRASGNLADLQHQHQRHHHHHLHHHNDLTDNNNAQAMSRSLSRETVNSSTECACSPSSSYNDKNTSRLRHNNSVPDFRNPLDFNEPSLTRATTSDADKHQSSDSPHAVRSESTGSAPLLLRNGLKMEAEESKARREDSFSPRVAINQPPSTPHLTSPSPRPSPPPPPTRPYTETDNDNSPKPCTCCCCCATSACAVNSHHHLMMEMQHPKAAPHCQISVRTREVAMHNTISEAFYRLDFYNAVHDIRRFNYICKLLHLLITQNLTSLSGCATRVLFTMLEQVAWEVSRNKRNVHVIRNLLNELKQTIQKYYCWGRPIGSSLLWQQHFETIERISQIVNGIELSPSKSESRGGVTFDKLPVEMIQEILLRLDDYRDLVSSAQASPVMQTMIDSQSIWQKLCRYHFTKQQLEMALSSGNNSILVKKGSRGVKYARTASADGRGSYRNPVAHKQTSSAAVSSGSSSAGSKAAATRRQLEQTSNRRGASGSTTDRRNSSADNGGRPPSKSASYVTNAVKIFDDKQRGLVRTNCDNESIAGSCAQSSSVAAEQKTGTRNCAGNRRSSCTASDNNGQEHAPADGGGHTTMELDSSNLEIDWERVFHQLRKRFDLKEEYADCLLLCRHCRCLFWKSFGHPCIKSDDMRQQPTVRHQRTSGPVEPSCLVARDGAAAAAAVGRDDPRARARQQQQRQHDDSSRVASRANAGANSSTSGRPSVASLSRSFDRATRSVENNGLLAAVADGNSPPRDGQRAEDLRRRSALPPAAPPSSAGSTARRPLNNLNAQLWEHNANRQQRQQQFLDHRENLPPAIRREELVPKHVTITPQAFLKFFSL